MNWWTQLLIGRSWRELRPAEAAMACVLGMVAGFLLVLIGALALDLALAVDLA